MNRVRHLALTAIAGGIVLGFSACNKPQSGESSTGPADKPLADIGAPLYPVVPLPKSVGATPAQAEPIIIPNAVVQNDIRIQVAAQADGIIEVIATESDGKTDPKDIVYMSRDIEHKIPYRRLREPNLVKKDQLIARQDDQLVALSIEQNKEVLEATKEAINAAKAAEQSQRDQLTTIKSVSGPAKLELLNLESLVARYIENRVQSEKERAKVSGELKTAQAQHRRYFIYSPIDGRIVKLLKNPQEFAKAGEPIMEIQALDTVRVEGKLDAQYAGQVKVGMSVTVEPARVYSPSPLSNYHRMEVTGVAVTAHAGRPMIVSAGLDASALIWDVTATKQSHRLPHPAGVGVRSVAATGLGTKTHLVATGSEDGVVRLWDLTNPDKLPKDPVVLFDEKHGSAVTAAAFSPDGKFLATAAGQSVFIWDVAAKKKKYALPLEHRDTVTTVRFTPQATLVTAARDKSIRTWKLGDLGANADKVIDHRGGGIDALGISADGGKVLFDKDASRLDIVSLTDERTVGTLQSPGGGARFANIALFSPDDKFILTAGGEADQRGELTLWEAPQPGGRGAELRRLVTPKMSPATCAAFSPDPTHRFLVVGTTEGGVHFWTPSVAQNLPATKLTAEIVSILPADARTLAIRVEMKNPVDNAGETLLDRSLATIIISPDGVPAAVVPAIPNAVRPVAATGTEVGGVIPAGGSVPAPIAPLTAGPSAPSIVPTSSPIGTVGPVVSRPATTGLPPLPAPPKK